jgi:sensor c-di-GMP phosphodiesterase-like protein
MTLAILDIEDALLAGDMFLEYLPIVDLAEDRCVGAEALVRWRRGARVIPPTEFIPCVEGTPLSGLLTYWLVDQLAAELGDWVRRTEGPFLSFNVPPELLGRGGLRYVAMKAGLGDILHRFVVEVTERGVPDELAIRSLAERNRFGTRLCLDDVGASDENLVLFLRADVDMIKFDQAFTARIGAPDWTPDELSTLSALAQTGVMQLVAEGIETERQRDLLRDAGVQMGQGWFFSRSLSARDFVEYYRVHGSRGS